MDGHPLPPEDPPPDRNLWIAIQQKVFGEMPCDHWGDMNLGAGGGPARTSICQTGIGIPSKEGKSAETLEFLQSEYELKKHLFPRCKEGMPCHPDRRCFDMKSPWWSDDMSNMRFAWRVVEEMKKQKKRLKLGYGAASQPGAWVAFDDNDISDGNPPPFGKTYHDDPVLAILIAALRCLGVDPYPGEFFGP